MKYKLTTNKIDVFQRTLYRIEATTDFGDVKKGQLGGYVESESNLSQRGECWIYDNAMVFDAARVYGDAKIYDEACIFAKAHVYGTSIVKGKANILDNVRIADSFVGDEAMVDEDAMVFDNARIYGNARVCGDARVSNFAEVFDNAVICKNAEVKGKGTKIGGKTIVPEEHKEPAFRHIPEEEQPEPIDIRNVGIYLIEEIEKKLNNFDKTLIALKSEVDRLNKIIDEMQRPTMAKKGVETR